MFALRPNLIYGKRQSGKESYSSNDMYPATANKSSWAES
jgi:hypothetical protein